MRLRLDSVAPHSLFGLSLQPNKQPSPRCPGNGIAEQYAKKKFLPLLKCIETDEITRLYTMNQKIAKYSIKSATRILLRVWCNFRIAYMVKQRVVLFVASERAAYAGG